jgi:hypothetical protein
MKTNLLLAASLILGSISSASSVASVILNINDPNPSWHTIVLDPVTFTVTADGNVGAIVFEDFFLAPNTSTATHVNSTMTAQIDGGATFMLDGETPNGTFSGTSSILDPDDLFYNILASDEFSVSVGQTVTIGGISIFSNPGLVAINTAFDQTAVLWDGVSNALSASTSLNPIPLPAAVWLFGSGLIGLVGVARRKKAA